MKALLARSVLNDCLIAHDLLERETRNDQWRVLWIGALALLRMVGSVLDRVDKNDDYFKDAIEKNWKNISIKEDNEIFWKFIKDSRDRALHEYETDPLDGDTIPLTLSIDGIWDGSRKIGECLFKPLEYGYKTGEDARDVYDEAIQWWNVQLSFIERESQK